MWVGVGGFFLGGGGAPGLEWDVGGGVSGEIIYTQIAEKNFSVGL